MNDSMEEISFKLYEQLCKASLKKTSKLGRSIIEHIVLAIAVSSLILLAISHKNFVFRPRHQDTLFSSECGVGGVQNEYEDDADILHFSILHDDGYDDEDDGDDPIVSSCLNGEGDNVCGGYASHSRYSSRKMNHNKSQLVYAKHEALLYMNDEMKEMYHVRESFYELRHSDVSCFGDEFQQMVLFDLFRDEEALLLNFVLHKIKGKKKSSLKHPQKESMGFIKGNSGKVMNLAVYQHQQQHYQNITSSYFRVPHTENLFRKIRIVLSMFVTFMALSTVVEFTLYETQMKMVDFTFELKDRVRHDMPLFSLIFTHILNMLLFIPLTIGILFLLQLVVFCDDFYLSFGVLSLIWFIQAYSAICVRSYPSIQFFSKTQLLYYALFHFYAQLYPNGFTHVALSVTTLFSLHSMIFFFNRYEIPAIQAGIIYSGRSRASIYQPRIYNRRVVVREQAGHNRRRSFNNSSGVDSRGIPMPQRLSRPQTPVSGTNQNPLSRSVSQGSGMGSASRNNSHSSFVMYEDGVSDDEEYVVYLNGEVVLPATSAVVRRRSDIVPNMHGDR